MSGSVDDSLPVRGAVLEGVVVRSGAAPAAATQPAQWQESQFGAQICLHANLEMIRGAPALHVELRQDVHDGPSTRPAGN